MHLQLDTTLASAFISILASVWLIPLATAIHARHREGRTYRSHVADIIRDFRENQAVLATIAGQAHKAAYPLQSHIAKLATPDDLLTPRVVLLGDLSERDRQAALWLTNLLVNINRDVEAILRLIERDRRPAFDRAVDELASKLGNLAERLERRYPSSAATAGSSGKAKTIYYEDGDVKRGLPSAGGAD